MFYVSICGRCNTGLDGDRYAAPHPDEECREFMRIRKAQDIPQKVQLDQLDLQAVLKYEKKHGKFPELDREALKEAEKQAGR